MYTLKKTVMCISICTIQMVIPAARPTDYSSAMSSTSSSPNTPPRIPIHAWTQRDSNQSPSPTSPEKKMLNDAGIRRTSMAKDKARLTYCTFQCTFRGAILGTIPTEITHYCKQLTQYQINADLGLCLIPLDNTPLMSASYVLDNFTKYLLYIVQYYAIQDAIITSEKNKKKAEFILLLNRLTLTEYDQLRQLSIFLGTERLSEFLMHNFLEQAILAVSKNGLDELRTAINIFCSTNYHNQQENVEKHALDQELIDLIKKSLSNQNMRIVHSEDNHIENIACNPHGTIALADSSKPLIQLCDLSTAPHVHPLTLPLVAQHERTHDVQFTALEWNPTGTHIAFITATPTTTCTWIAQRAPNGAHGRVIKKTTHDSAHKYTQAQSSRPTLAWNYDGTLLAVTTNKTNNAISIFLNPVHSSTQEQTIITLDAPVVALQWNPRHNMLAAHYVDGRTMLLDLTRMTKPKKTLLSDVQHGYCTALAWNTQGTLLATGSNVKNAGILYVWVQIADGTWRPHAITKHDNMPLKPITSAMWLTDNILIATNEIDNTIYVWHVLHNSKKSVYIEDMQNITTPVLNNEYRVTALTKSRGGLLVISQYEKNDVSTIHSVDLSDTANNFASYAANVLGLHVMPEALTHACTTGQLLFIALLEELNTMPTTKKLIADNTSLIAQGFETFNEAIRSDLCIWYGIPCTSQQAPKKITATRKACVIQ